MAFDPTKPVSANNMPDWAVRLGLDPKLLTAEINPGEFDNNSGQNIGGGDLTGFTYGTGQNGSNWSHYRPDGRQLGVSTGASANGPDNPNYPVNPSTGTYRDSNWTDGFKVDWGDIAKGSAAVLGGGYLLEGALGAGAAAGGTGGGLLGSLGYDAAAYEAALPGLTAGGTVGSEAAAAAAAAGGGGGLLSSGGGSLGYNAAAYESALPGMTAGGTVGSEAAAAAAAGGGAAAGSGGASGSLYGQTVAEGGLPGSAGTGYTVAPGGGAQALTGALAGSASGGLLNSIASTLGVNPNTVAQLGGAALGALAGSQTSTQTASRDPWAPAQQWLKDNITSGQALQKQYADHPFNQQQMTAYQNQANNADNFRSNIAPGLMNFANGMMNSNYQRTLGAGAPGAPAGPAKPQTNPFTVGQDDPTKNRYGLLNFNPFGGG